MPCFPLLLPRLSPFWLYTLTASNTDFLLAPRQSHAFSLLLPYTMDTVSFAWNSLLLFTINSNLSFKIQLRCHLLKEVSHDSHILARSNSYLVGFCFHLYHSTYHSTLYSSVYLSESPDQLRTCDVRDYVLFLFVVSALHLKNSP